MTITPSAAEVRQASTTLSSPALIRLITEIDDNGPVPSRGLARTLADLPAHQLRPTIESARNLGLVQVRPGIGLDLTESGLALADLYDALARWARRHSYPAPTGDFRSRLQHTLARLADVPDLTAEPDFPEAAACPPASAETEADLTRPRDLLRQWLRSHPQVVQLVPPA